MEIDKTLINQFLKELYIIEEDYARQEKNKEQFNIFSILYKADTEKKLHSRFISSLLDIHGSHKMGNLFLRTFLKTCKYEEDFIENLLYDDYVEVTPNERNKSESHDIDILVINKKTHYAFYVENKINAHDSNHEDRGQLEGYFETLLNTFHIPRKNIEMVFLTMWGREPTDESYGTRNPEIKKKCKVCTYNQIIIPWLESCLTKCIDKPFIRETLLQYIKLIKDMTNDISINERKEIQNLIGKNEDNLKAAKLLVDNFKHVKWHTVCDFYDELTKRLEKEGCCLKRPLVLDDVTFVTHNEIYKQGYKTKVLETFYKCPSGLEFYISYDYDFYLNFGILNNKNNRQFKEQIDTLISDNEDFEHDKNNLMWKEFDLPEEENIYFGDFSYEGTFNLISPEYRNKIINKIVNEIIKTFKKINVLK